MARKTKEDAEQTRQSILDSALQTFYEKGFARTTFDEIAKRINLTKGAVYWHFRNKTDLIAALIQQKIMKQRAMYPLEKPQTLDDLRQAIRTRSAYIEKDGNYRRFLFFIIYRMEWSEAVFAKVWPEIGELCELPEKQLYEILCELQKKGEIKADADVGSLQEILVCLWKGVIGNYIAGHKMKEGLQAMMVRGFDAVMKSVKVEKI